MNPSTEALVQRFRDIQALQAAESLMSWDRQVLMPPGGVEARSAHMATLSRMEHELWTSHESLRLLESAERDAAPGSVDAAVARVFRREVDTRTKLPAELVERKAKVAGDAYEVWKKARAESNFPAMRPFWQELFEINRETSRLLDPHAKHPYDPLLDQYEEGATTADARAMFGAIKDEIVDFVREITERGEPVEDGFMYGDWDQAAIRNASEEITKAIGFNYACGRLDIAPNAFCMNLSNRDVRLTTKPSDHVKGVLSSSLHEMGHGLYEQGSRDEWDRTPLAGGISLAVHESQSRLWENVIGRSEAFWSNFFPVLQKHVRSMANVDLPSFHRAINKVQPSLIRVGSDELTYNLHILVRFEIETEIMSGTLEVGQIPDAWNEKYQRYLGLVPPDDGQGCLQDVHWSRGYCGYFPTYSMGNLISGMVWATLRKDLEVDPLMRRGDFCPILEWLRERIYRQGCIYPPKDLVKRVTGSEMRADEWLSYSRDKFGAVYGLVPA